MKRAIIVHGWSGSPKGNWFPWLKKQLEAKAIYVDVPAMPNPDTPEIEPWVNHLAKYVDTDADNYLIGHSMGCQAILRYLENRPENIKIKGVLLVAGFIDSLSEAVMKSPEDAKIAQPWLETPININKAKTIPGKIISIFSDDDPYVPEDNWKKFEELGEVIILDKKGHIQELEEPEVLKAALKLLQ